MRHRQCPPSLLTLSSALLLGSAAPGSVAPPPVSNPAPRTATRADVRILLIYDLEGASRAGEPRGALSDSELAARDREALTSDVSSVVDGLFAGGATAVDVFNSHGEGDPTLVPAARLDSRVRVIPGPERNIDIYGPTNELVRRGAYTGVVLVGMHDKPLSGGFSPHTLGAGLSPVINGHTLTESELVGYAFGTVDIPVIFVSGDDHLMRDLAESMSWVEYVVVKKATGPGTVDTLPSTRVRSELRSRATRALGELPRMRPMRLTAPIRAGMLASFPAHPRPGLRSGAIPGLEGRGDTTTFVAPDYATAYRGIRFLIGVSASDLRRALVLDLLSQRPELREAIRQAHDSVTSLWVAFEQGKYKP